MGIVAKLYRSGELVRTIEIDGNVIPRAVRVLNRPVDATEISENARSDEYAEYQFVSVSESYPTEARYELSE